MKFKSLFFAGREQGLTRDEVNAYRKNFGLKFQQLGFDVKDPSLGKTEQQLMSADIIKEDCALIDQCHLTIAYLPPTEHVSNRTLAEIKRAKSNKQLVFGFTDKNNPVPSEFIPFLDRWFENFEELCRVLSIYISPVGEYFTTAHTNGMMGDLIIYGVDVATMEPHYIHDLLKKVPTRKNVFYFCCETSHINDLAQKLPTIFRLEKINEVFLLTKDGSPHDVQIHTLVQEVAENTNFENPINYYVVEKSKLHLVTKQAVKLSRHLSLIESSIKQSPNLFVAVLVGAKSDESAIQESGLLQLLDNFKIKHQFIIISSDRNPEQLRTYCLENAQNIQAVIAVAGGVPNLPIVAKSWLPDTVVISVPLDDKTDYALASLTTPKDLPIIVSGFGIQGLKKAAYLLKTILNQN